MIIRAVLERASQLDENARSLLVLRFHHDCTFLEIAQRLGVSELTARTWYHKAIKTLSQPVMSQSSYNTHTPHTEES
jgi:RNA polymerase sigma factor (sigma-70 family)